MWEGARGRGDHSDVVGRCDREGSNSEGGYDVANHIATVPS